jgi:hypothetical protein
MATSSRQSALFGIQDWKRFYQTYREADFRSYDYETLRKSFIDYLTAYYPETFNDYIESSEYVALLDVIAYMGQALAFRSDLNTRENFIDTAERRDSVIKLANLVGYTPKRNIAGQGLLKLTAISTSENVLDINGVNLSNSVILWNDAANKNWQDQFNLIINAALIDPQRIGRPGNSSTILGVKSDEYTINLPVGTLPVVPFKAEIDSTSMNFECVSVTSINSESYYELPPAPTGQFTMLYRNDKLGYGSVNTGFFLYFKQGTLLSSDFRFTEGIENNFQAINIMGINDTDVWLYQLNDANTEQFLWSKVDNIYINSSTQTSTARKIFSVTSRFNDQITYVFGDGTFGEVPVGQYRSYVRSSNALSYAISPSEMQGIVVTIPYISRNNKAETLTVTLSLQSTSSTAQERESLANIKERAPARYYTQNRMVNGEDYSNFPYTQFNSIVKSKALNRSSIGISRNLDLLDPTTKYSSTNIFADDGALYTDSNSYTTTFSTSSINVALEFMSSRLPALLADSAALQHYHQNYPRYSTESNIVYWKKLTVSDNLVTGYFYTQAGGGENPLSVGASASSTLKYITKGAQLKFIAPLNFCFDASKRLVNRVPNFDNGDSTYLWAGVTEVLGDGKNYGQLTYSDGTGGVKLNTYVPSGALLENNSANSIIPAFDNTIDNTVINDCIDLIKQNQNFYLMFDNSVALAFQRWSVVQYDNPNWFVKFTYNSVNSSYSVTVKNVNYYFGSVREVRFAFDKNKKIFDPKSGQVINDFVSVLKSNSKPESSAPLGMNHILSVSEQMLLSDGYPDDFQIKISSIDNNTKLSYDPDFFSRIVDPSSLVFFKLVTDSNYLSRTELLPAGQVVTIMPGTGDINTIARDYKLGTIFYVTSTGAFYQSSAGPDSATVILTNVSARYTVRTGRGNLSFQYRHNSDNTTRINPAVTNIIDLYLVTQSYYRSYQNWLNDSTGVTPEPEKPSSSELQQAYGNLDNYKMISDTVVYNSVTFKPLFGTKAQAALQGKIKVIKNPNITISDSQIRSSVLSALNSYFTIDKWDFGDIFYFSELSAYLHVQLAGIISSVVVVPNNENSTFGELYEIRSSPHEIFVNGATAGDIIVISALTPQAIQQSA